MLVNISSDIINSLKYFSECIYFERYSDYYKDILNLVDKNGNIELPSNAFNLSMYKIEIDDTGGMLNVYYKDRSGNDRVQKWKIGKFILVLFKSLLNKELYDVLLDNLAQSFIGYEGFKNYLKHNNLKIIIDDNFFKGYTVSNYSEVKGSLGHSCMNDNEAVMCFYTILSSKVSIVRIEDSSGKVYGRCLLWETNKGKYLDRFYTVNNMYFSSFYLYMLKEYGINYNYVCSFTNEYVINFDKGDIDIGVSKLEKIYNKKKDDIINYILSTGTYKSIYIDTMKYIYTDISDKHYVVISNKSFYSNNLISIEEFFYLFLDKRMLIYKYSKYSNDLPKIYKLINLDSLIKETEVILLNFISFTERLYFIFKIGMNKKKCYIGIIYPYEGWNLFYILFYFTTDKNGKWIPMGYTNDELASGEGDIIIDDIENEILSSDYKDINKYNIKLLNLRKNFPLFIPIKNIRDFFDYYRSLSNDDKNSVNYMLKEQSLINSFFLENLYFILDPTTIENSIYICLSSSLDVINKKIKEIKRKYKNKVSDKVLNYFKAYNDINLLYNDSFAVEYMK